ncbi:hypothetical protein L1987_06458 [Smallanthus sonchifolius]|uniref:Uncharacterized protein n=1 Tax=Smallanthus sonchifolius TaxID=185202 RepID=A0ACB9JY81_9ASTR|nr:hypothetical protein L1987_06458 [Smallanthus sonchifolius]
MCKFFYSLQFSGGNATRRDLAECAANNIIDKCWRCKPDWDKNRQALAQCAAGFAKGTTGGSGGEVYIVTDPTDADAAAPKPGTLRAGVTQNKAIWVTFEKDMVITLTQELVITSDTTIDGRGAKVEITGAGLTLYNVKNVIVHGLNIHDIKESPGGMIKNSDGPPGLRLKTDGDGICVTGSSKIWIDHCSLSKGPDGLIDVTLKSTAVTISNCKFTNHHKVLARADAPEEEWKKWNWRTEKDALLNGAVFVPSGVDPPLTPEQKELLIVAEPGESVPQLTNAAGVLSCMPGQPC